ncbi:MAG: 4-vinyl reductase [Chloroflexi bacterium]|nr:4-vinyl reductase [Chloroflexota bacterium]MBU1746848.1 4-vinyl reductase [Chloroflexota bacterium]
MGRIFLTVMEEIMGTNGVNAILNMAQMQHYIGSYPPRDLENQFPFEDYARLSQAILDFYGPRGGRGLLLRAGRSTFKYGLKEFGPLLGLADLAFRLMPLGMKLKIGINAVAETFDKFSDMVAYVIEEKDQFVYVIEVCPECTGRKDTMDRPTCFLATGILQESVNWLSGGKNFRVMESICMMSGDHDCRFNIDKTPMD